MGHTINRQYHLLALWSLLLIAAQPAVAVESGHYLVGLGLPFRDAHEVVGKAVAHGIDSGLDLAEMELATLQGFCADIREDVFQVLTLEGSIAARNHLGGTAPQQVAAAAVRARDLLADR